MVQPAKSSTPAEVLAGLVDRVTFHNSENGFCVLRVKARGQRDLITVIGQKLLAGSLVVCSDPMRLAKPRWHFSASSLLS
jgi:hypothetical protein